MLSLAVSFESLHHCGLAVHSQHFNDLLLFLLQNELSSEFERLVEGLGPQVQKLPLELSSGCERSQVLYLSLC